MLELLRVNKIDVNCRNIAGRTPLHCAVQAKNYRMIDIFLREGAKINISDMDIVGRYTPMHMATEENMKDVVEMFMSRGGDPEI